MGNAILIIRPATPADTESVMQFLEPFVEQRKLLRRSPEEIQSLTVFGFVAVVEEEIVGFAAIEIYGRKLAEIQCMAVNPEYQRMGIGRELVRLCVENAKSRDVMEVMAISASDEFLRTCGFDYALPDQKRALFLQIRPRT